MSSELQTWKGNNYTNRAHNIIIQLPTVVLCPPRIIAISTSFPEFIPDVAQEKLLLNMQLHL